MLRRIRTDQVRIGMFLHAVDAGWLDNPFWRSRFPIAEAADVERLRESGIATVVIDLARGRGVDEGVGAERVALAVDPAAAPLPVAPDTPPSATAREQAARVIARSKEQMKAVFEDARLGRAIEAETVRSLVDEIASSVQAHPHALLGMVRLKTKDEYTYLHSVAVCALMVNLARALDMDDAAVRDLGLAGLLHDIGKMAVPTAILNKPGKLDDDEFAVIRTHPDRGCEMLLSAADMPPVVLDVCRHHHEKIDGTGYPLGLSCDAISLAARMGAVCDVYDAITSERPYKAGWSPAEAVAAMTGWTGQFDPAILFVFLRSIAVFPTGMLVRMRSGHLGIVLPNGRRASRPRIRLFYDLGAGALMRPRDLVLAGADGTREVAAEERPDDWPPRDWPALRARLLVEPDALDVNAVARLWYAVPVADATPVAARTRVSLWQPAAG